jgi:hypothetical protein
MGQPEAQERTSAPVAFDLQERYCHWIGAALVLAASPEKAIKLEAA